MYKFFEIGGGGGVCIAGVFCRVRGRVPVMGSFLKVASLFKGHLPKTISQIFLVFLKFGKETIFDFIGLY